VPDRDARDIGDRVELTGLESPDAKPKITKAGASRIGSAHITSV
jgi:hypothetical protein